MRKIAKIAAAAVLLACFGQGAHALPFIAAGSTLSLNGNDSFDATSVNFLGLADNLGADSGDFSILPTCLGCVTMFDFTSASTSFLVYSFSEAGISTDLTLDAVSFAFTPGPPFDTLTVTGTGTADLTGFAPTPGEFSLTTQGNSGRGVFTFSSTTGALPVSEPGTLAYLGLALLALWGLRRRHSGRMEAAI